MIATSMLLAVCSVVWLSFYLNVFLLLWGLNRSRGMNRNVETLKNDPRRFIVQVCTSGRAPKSVNSILETVRSYSLKFPYETWVVVEAYDRNEYKADRVVTVPADFTTPNGTGAKARALEYAREVRIREGIEDETTKILFLDDDSVPERGYVEYAYHSSFDVGHGFIKTDRNYGTNVLTSVADNFRVTDCVATCATFASRGKPKLIHGEGLVVRGNVEKEVTWDWGGAASWGEDLLFGTKAAREFKYGFIPFSVHISSPFTVRDLYKQRRRWFWGSILSLKQLTNTERSFITLRLFCGFMAIPSVTLMAYSSIENVTFPLPFRVVFSIGTVFFASYYLIGSWLNTRTFKKVLQTLTIFWLASLMEAPILFFSILSRPKTFEVIRKE